MEEEQKPLTIDEAKGLRVYIENNEPDSEKRQREPLAYGNRYVDADDETQAKQRTEQVLQWVIDNVISMPPGMTEAVVEQLLQHVKDSKPGALGYALASKWAYLDYFTEQYIKKRDDGLL